MTFPCYPAYKDSGVEWLGEVPEHWEEKPLKTVTSINDEVLSESVSIDHEIEYVDISSVSLANGIERTESVIFGDAPSRARRIPRDGDVLVSTVRTYLKAIAPVVSPPCNLVASTGFAVVRPQRGIHPGYLKYALQEEHFIQQVISRSTGVSYPAINASDIARIPLSLPKQSEQLAIATFLDRETAKIDALIAEQQRLIELLQEKRQAVISHAVTKGLNPDAPMKDSGVEWLGEVPEHWGVMGLTKAIGPVVDYRGRTPAKRDSGTLLVTARNIRNGKIDYALSEEYVDPVEAEELLQRGRPKLGDVLFTMEAPLGQVAVVDREDIALAQRVVKFRGIRDRMTNSFLMWWLIGSHCQYQLNSLSTGSTALGIKASKLSAVICVVPPVSEQQAIDAHVRDCNTRFSRVHAAALDQIELLQERRSALISAAVTGQIDVRGLVPEAEAA
ncbi:MAG: restriction endonuclease subunit S [Cyanobacteriota bacterium]